MNTTTNIDDFKGNTLSLLSTLLTSLLFPPSHNSEANGGVYGTYITNDRGYYGAPSNKSTCPAPASLELADGKLSITEWTLIPTCILALIIGLYTSKQIRTRTRFQSKWIYEIAFFSFGIMMSSALVLHCFLSQQRNLLGFIVLIIDVGLTSSIATTFMWAGLADIHLLDAKSSFTKICVYGSFPVIFIAYILCILSQVKYTFLILYSGVVGLTCFIYLITQIMLMLHMHSLRGIGSFVSGGWAGAIGLGGVTLWANEICELLGPYWAPLVTPEFIWFILSDVSVYFVYLYVFKSRVCRARCDKENLETEYHQVRQEDEYDDNYHQEMIIYENSEAV